MTSRSPFAAAVSPIFWNKPTLAGEPIALLG